MPDPNARAAGTKELPSPVVRQAGVAERLSGESGGRKRRHEDELPGSSMRADALRLPEGATTSGRVRSLTISVTIQLQRGEGVRQAAEKWWAGTGSNRRHQDFQIR
jgi:hypothetical protein